MTSRGGWSGLELLQHSPRQGAYARGRMKGGRGQREIRWPQEASQGAIRQQDQRESRQRAGRGAEFRNCANDSQRFVVHREI